MLGVVVFNDPVNQAVLTGLGHFSAALQCAKDRCGKRRQGMQQLILAGLQLAHLVDQLLQ